ncbi:uncharacterized protein RMCN_0735 [Mycolicibacterium novocastrense]|uniref:Uncharacterized protein n=1 Tax=Mycolicibacterium novocastrense TaxID=59813 RepID=A0ABQ0KE03_MYCNV|nr:uncharacterized protein RMCN_0735 [Mycolicibacterium novocastrense]
MKKAAARATRASAKLENRSVPTGYVRPAAVRKLLAERPTRNELALYAAEGREPPQS